MQLPYSEELNIENFSRLFDNTSECYKFFWFKAIVGKAVEGKQEITYEELVDEMIAEAWYMVTEYHLNMWPRDTLENLAMIDYVLTRRFSFYEMEPAFNSEGFKAYQTSLQNETFK